MHFFFIHFFIVQDIRVYFPRVLFSYFILILIHLRNCTFKSSYSGTDILNSHIFSIFSLFFCILTVFISLILNTPVIYDHYRVNIPSVFSRHFCAHQTPHQRVPKGRTRSSSHIARSHTLWVFLSQIARCTICGMGCIEVLQTSSIS